MTKLIGLSKKSIDRRINRSSENSNNRNSDYIYETDLPISNNNINEILKCNNNDINIELNKKSNWLNSITIKLSNNNNNIDFNDYENIINCITSKPFVSKIDLVSKINKNTKINNNNNNNQFFKPVYNGLNQFSVNSSKNSFQSGDEKFTPNFYGRSYNAIKLSNIDKLHKMGLDGSGIKILVIDSGFHLNNQIYKELKVVKQFGFYNISDTDAENDNFHGTATLSVIGGYLPGTHIGSAYNASYYLSKMDLSDDIVFQDVIPEGLEVAEKEGIDIITCSMGFGQIDGEYLYYNEDEYFITKIADTLVSKGVVFISSAGNTGEMGMYSPAYSQQVITVGSVYINGTTTEWSSLGPNSNGIVKPDIMALGVNMSIIWNNTFALAMGTSFSAPLIAGGIALIMQSHPNYTPTQIHEAILLTGSQSSNPNSHHGYGIFDAYKALTYLNHSYSQTSSCSLTGCTNENGLCCNDKCVCAPAYYGSKCQFKRLECGDQCTIDYNLPNRTISMVSVCQKNSLGYPSFKCVYRDAPIDQLLTLDNPYHLNSNQIKSCHDTKFIINYSLNSFNILNLNLIILSIIFIILLI